MINVDEDDVDAGDGDGSASVEIDVWLICPNLLLSCHTISPLCGWDQSFGLSQCHMVICHLILMVMILTMVIKIIRMRSTVDMSFS